MIYLITKLWFFLLIAFVFGAYIGWSTCRVGKSD